MSKTYVTRIAAGGVLGALVLAVAAIMGAPSVIAQENTENTGDTEVIITETTEGAEGEATTETDTTMDEEQSDEASPEIGEQAPVQDETEAAQQQNNDQPAVADADNPYAYTAQDGDNYSVLARKAIQTYGIIEGVDLSQAQIVAAETKLAADAGFPELDLGQVLTFDVSDIRGAVEYAQQLSEDQIASWQTYVPYVDFDTSNNGGK
ncbi:hypothetical protein CR970_02175 [Candidatus Saccharibacteria bacterium]|nr:MAG: hypothetical protein CR970_02175 [Candidatus Saccharibacteria bacterium]